MTAVIHRPRRTARPLASAAALALGLAAQSPVEAAPPRPVPDTPSMRCPTPRNWRIVPDPEARIQPVRNAVTVDRESRIFWNNMPISIERLETYLGIVAMIRPAPELRVEIDPGTPCDQAARIVAMVAAAVDCSRLCSHTIIPWRQRPSVAPPAPPAPPSRFRPVPATPSQFRPLPAPSAPPVFRPVPGPPAPSGKDAKAGPPK